MQTNSHAVVITGVSRGIGLALAQEFIAHGSTVFGCSRSEPVERIESSNFHFQKVDVSSSHDVKNWASEVTAKCSLPNIVINNAGVVNDTKPCWEISAEEFDRVIDINVKGVANILREFLPVMNEAKKGLILNMSSGWGRFGEKFVAPYCASKFAVEGISQSVAKEVSNDVVVVSLSPGIVKTSMLESCSPNYFEDAPNAKNWAKKAVSIILGMSKSDNGAAMTISI